MSHEQTHKTLDQIPANRDLIEELFAHDKISREARDHALHLIHPHAMWGLWISRLLLGFGVALLLCGIVFFFAFNWVKLTPLIKFSLVEIGIVLCLAGAFYLTLQNVVGRVLLLCASILVGVFMAVFGQIYQTGADSYQLFMMWSLLTLGWTLLSRYTVQWVFWLVVTNIFLLLWWEQAANPAKNEVQIVYLIAGLLNGIVLALREFLVLKRGYLWPAPQWTRAVLVVVILAYALALALQFVFDDDRLSAPIALSGFIGAIILGAAYLIYRLKIPDMWSLALAVLSLCILIVAICAKLLSEMIQHSEATIFLLLGLITVGLFTLAGMHLKNLMVRHD